MVPGKIDVGMVPLEHMVSIIDIDHCGLIYVIEAAAKGGPARQQLLSWAISPTSDSPCRFSKT
jgi:hypothetical protein